MIAHLPAAGHRRVPWRNGGGVTDEIAVGPHPDDPDRFAWRLSVAHVAAAGSFSSFPGVDRTLMLVDGAGMDLRFADGPWRRVDRPFDPIAFAGETPVECRLIAGPVRDLNVMADRATTLATVEVVQDDAEGRTVEVAADPDDFARERIVVGLRGASVARCDRASWTLDAIDALRIGAEDGVTLQIGAAGAVVVVRLARRR